jgi:hypothetical protein
VSPLAARPRRARAGDASPLARVPGTHFARWVIVDDVVYEGGRQKRDALEGGAAAVHEQLRRAARALPRGAAHGAGRGRRRDLGPLRGLPGQRGDEAFAAWLRAHQVESSLFFAAYGDQTVAEVRRNLDAARG